MKSLYVLMFWIFLGHPGWFFLMHSLPAVLFLGYNSTFRNTQKCKRCTARAEQQQIIYISSLWRWLVIIVCGNNLNVNKYERQNTSTKMDILDKRRQSWGLTHKVFIFLIRDGERAWASVLIQTLSPCYSHNRGFNIFFFTGHRQGL